MQLQLTVDDLAVLQDILSTELGVLKEQVYKAEVTEFKETLKIREGIVQSLLDRLQAATA